MYKSKCLAAAAAVLCLPLAAMAQEAPRYLSDPNFLPLTGQIYGSSNYTHIWNSGDVFNGSGAETSTFNTNTDTLSQFFSYGITDDLSVNGTLHYEPDSNRNVSYANGTSASFNSSGFDDPSFGVTWRALEQGMFPVNVDVFGSYTPNIFGAKIASANGDGTVARGGDSGIAGAAVGYETPQLGLRGFFEAHFFGRSGSTVLATGDNLTTDGYTDYVLGLESQYRFNPLFSVNAGIDHTFTAHENALDENTGITHILNPGNSTALHAQLNYNLVPDKVVLAGIYTHNFQGNLGATFANPASDYAIRNRSADSLGVQLYYTLP